MSILDAKKSFLPLLDGRALDFIKIAAVIFMVIDHINHVWYKSEIIEMGMVGRTTFPLFCYAVAISVMRGGAEKIPHYMSRLILFGLISQPITTLAWDDMSIVNVLFTLAFGALVCGLTYKLKDWQMYLLHIGGALCMLAKMPIEFGMAGVMLPSAFLMVLQGKKGALPTLLLLLMLINMSGIYEGIGIALEKGSFSLFSFPLMLGVCATLFPWMTLEAGKYFKQDGRYLSKYFLHVFYPAHLFIIWALGLVFFK